MEMPSSHSAFLFHIHESSIKFIADSQRNSVDVAHMQVEGKGWMGQAIPSAADSGQYLP